MKNLFNNMDSSEIGRILEMHKKKGYGTIITESPMDSMFYQGDDYTKDMGKNLMLQDDDDNFDGMRKNFDFDTFKNEVSIMAPGSAILLDKDKNVVKIIIKRSKWFNKKHFNTLLKNYSNLLEKIPSDVHWVSSHDDVENIKFKIKSKE